MSIYFKPPNLVNVFLNRFTLTSTNEPTFFCPSSQGCSAIDKIPRGQIKGFFSLFGPYQVRFAHSNMTWPDFDDIRYNVDHTSKEDEYKNYKDATSLALFAATGSVALYGMKSAIKLPGHYLSPSKEVIALSSLEIDITEIQAGDVKTFNWRGKPIFIRHRTPEQIDSANSVDIGSLRDPQVDSARTVKPEWLVLIGICTHLGCVPLVNKGKFTDGYFCPCHGSHYDSSGRIRLGPAPFNLEVAPHRFLENEIMKLG